MRSSPAVTARQPFTTAAVRIAMAIDPSPRLLRVSAIKEDRGARVPALLSLVSWNTITVTYHCFLHHGSSCKYI